MVARPDLLPTSPASTTRMTEGEPLQGAEGGTGDAKSQVSEENVATVPDGPVDYDDIVLRAMVRDLDDLDIPAPPTMAPPDQLSPLNRYLADLERAPGGREEEEELSSITMTDEGPPATSAVKEASSTSAPSQPTRQGFRWPPTVTPEHDDLDYSPGPASASMMSVLPVPSPLSSTPTTPGQFLEDVTPNSSPGTYSVDRYPRSMPFSPPSDSLETLDRREAPDCEFEI